VGGVWRDLRRAHTQIHGAGGLLALTVALICGAFAAAAAASGSVHYGGAPLAWVSHGVTAAGALLFMREGVRRLHRLQGRWLPPLAMIAIALEGMATLAVPDQWAGDQLDTIYRLVRAPRRFLWVWCARVGVAFLLVLNFVTG
jgi:hypothetical protein